MRERICRLCGRKYEPRESDAAYCSPLCKMAGESLSAKEGPSGERPPMMNGKWKGGGRPPEWIKYPRVMAMFKLPIGERGKMAISFTPEEEAFSRKMMKRMLNEERRLDECLSWDGEGGYGDLERVKGISGDKVGESDDGTV